MAIKVSKKELRESVRKSYLKKLIREEEEMSSQNDDMKDAAFEIAKKVARAIENVSINRALDSKQLLSCVIDQVKLQMK